MYRTSFQHPTTGETVAARYAAGRLTLECGFDDDPPSKTVQAFCKANSKSYVGTIDAADVFIAQISDGTALPLERVS